MKDLNPFAARDAKELGGHIRDWRKVRNMTAQAVAARAGVNRATLRSIETGTGTPSIGAVLSVMTVLGMDRPVIEAADPLRSDLGRARAGLIDRQRVR